MRNVPFDDPGESLVDRLFDADTDNILNLSIAPEAPSFYPYGKVFKPSDDIFASVYDIQDNLIANQGYIRVSFIPNKIHAALDDEFKRSYICSIGRPDCVGITPTPNTLTEVPSVYLRHLTGGLDRLLVDKQSATPFFVGEAVQITATGALGIIESISITTSDIFFAFIRPVTPNIRFTAGTVMTDTATTTKTANITDVKIDNQKPEDLSEHLDMNVYGRVFDQVWNCINANLNFNDDPDDEIEQAKGIARDIDDDGRGAIDNAPGTPGFDYSRFFFRRQNFQTGDPVDSSSTASGGKVERWAPAFVKQSMAGLIEIWIQKSPYRLHTLNAPEELFTVHASLCDNTGALLYHLAGDVRIPVINQEDLHEIELNIDLKDVTTLTFGRSIKQLIQETEIDIISFSSINNTIIVDDTTGLEPDDIIVLSIPEIPSSSSSQSSSSSSSGLSSSSESSSSSAGPPTNSGLLRIAQINGTDEIRVAEAIIDETPPADITVKVYKYKEIGETRIISEMFTSDPSAYDLAPGLETGNTGYDVIVDLLKDLNDLPDNDDITELRDAELAFFKEENQLLASGQPRKFETALKSPNSQRFGNYRSPIVREFNVLLGNAVFCLGAPISALNLDRGDTYQNENDDDFVGYKSFITDEGITGTDGFLIESAWLNLLGIFPIDTTGSEGPQDGCIFPAGSSSSAIALR